MSWIENPGWEEFHGLSVHDLKVDEAYVNITSQLKGEVWLYSLSDACYKCPYTRLTAVSFGEKVIKVSTRFGTSWRLMANGFQQLIPRQNRSELLCELEPSFGEFGVYDMVIKGTGTSDVCCSLSTVQDPVNIYLSLLMWLLLEAIFWVTYSKLSFYYNKWKYRSMSIPSHSNAKKSSTISDEKDEDRQPTTQTQRLKSLDTFRGFIILSTFYGNEGAGSYWFMDHAVWNGLVIGDVLFPWFIWIMGVCLPISIKSQLTKNVPRFKIFFGAMRRACGLFLLGLLINFMKATTWETTRILGVFQRFGIVYFIIATLSIFFTSRRYGFPKGPVQDIIVLTPQWLVIIGIIVFHYALTFNLEVPGCPMGYLGPGGIQDNGDFRHCIGGATGYIDRMILGETHIYQNATTNEIYQAGPFEPEGILGSLLSVFQGFLGVQAGTTLSLYRNWKDRIKRWLAWGTVSGIIGAILCQASLEDGWIPINKNLWSLSFALVTSSFAFYLLAVCYFVIDVKSWWSGMPFFYPGMNATFMYISRALRCTLIPWRWSNGTNTHFILLMESFWESILCILLAVWLYRINFFLSF